MSNIDSQILSDRARAEQAAKIAETGEGVNTDYVSLVVGQKPDPYVVDTGLPVGSYLVYDGIMQRVKWNSNTETWEDFGPTFSTIDGLKVDNVEDLKEKRGGVDGQIVELLGYYTKGDGGGGVLYWDASSNETPNDGTIFQVTNVTTGRWKRPDVGYLNVKWFGAKGDDTSGDGARCNAAHVAAHDTNRRVFYPKGTYDCTDETLRLFHRNTYEGSTGGVIIKNTSTDKPVMASDIWLNGGFTGGRCRVKHFTLQGGVNATDTANDNHGIVLLDFRSVIEDVWVEGVGGNGIRVTDTYKDGSRYTVGSLIDNYIIDCGVFGAVEYSFFLGEESSPPVVTDGYLINCKARATRSIKQHVYVGVATGWHIDGIHLFGTETPNEGIRINNAHYTRISDIYIENYSDYGLIFTKLQKGTSITGGNFKMGAGSAGSRAIYAEKSSVVDNVDLSIVNVNFDQPNATSLKAIETNTSLINVWTKNLSFSGSNADSIIKYTSPATNATNIRRLEDVVLDHSLRMGLNNKTLNYRGNNLALNESKSFSTQAVSAEFTVNIHNFRVCNIPVYINGFQNMWQAKRVSYQGMISVGRMADAVDINDFAIDLTHVLHTAGEFNESPSVTLDSVDIPNNTVTFTISFTSSNADADGAISIYPSIN